MKALTTTQILSSPYFKAYAEEIQQFFEQKGLNLQTVWSGLTETYTPLAFQMYFKQEPNTLTLLKPIVKQQHALFLQLLLVTFYFAQGTSSKQSRKPDKHRTFYLMECVSLAMARYPKQPYQKELRNQWQRIYHTYQQHVKEYQQRNLDVSALWKSILLAINTVNRPSNSIKRYLLSRNFGSLGNLLLTVLFFFNPHYLLAPYYQQSAYLQALDDIRQVRQELYEKDKIYQSYFKQLGCDPIKEQEETKTQLNHLKGQHYKTKAKLEFVERQMQDKGNCGFQALSVDRADFVEALLSMADDLSSRQALFEEIYEALQMQILLLSRDDKKRWGELTDAYKASDELLKSALSKAVILLKASEKKIICDLNMKEKLQFLKQASSAEYVNFAQAYQSEQKCFNNIKVFCTSKPLYTHYVKQYLNKSPLLWMGYHSAVLYAKSQKDLSVFIWKKRQNQSLEHLVCCDVGVQARIEVHLLLTRGYTHFNLLEPVVQENQCVPLGATQSVKTQVIPKSVSQSRLFKEATSVPSKSATEHTIHYQIFPKNKTDKIQCHFMLEKGLDVNYFCEHLKTCFGLVQVKSSGYLITFEMDAVFQNGLMLGMQNFRLPNGVAVIFCKQKLPDEEGSKSDSSDFFPGK